MASYNVTSFVTDHADFDTVVAALVTQLDLIDNTKTLRLIEIKNQGSNFRGAIIYDE